MVVKISVLGTASDTVKVVMGMGILLWYTARRLLSMAMFSSWGRVTTSNGVLSFEAREGIKTIFKGKHEREASRPCPGLFFRFGPSKYAPNTGGAPQIDGPSRAVWRRWVCWRKWGWGCGGVRLGPYTNRGLWQTSTDPCHSKTNQQGRISLVPGVLPKQGDCIQMSKLDGLAGTPRGNQPLFGSTIPEDTQNQTCYRFLPAFNHIEGYPF